MDEGLNEDLIAMYYSISKRTEFKMPGRIERHFSFFRDIHPLNIDPEYEYKETVAQILIDELINLGDKIPFPDIEEFIKEMELVIKLKIENAGIDEIEEGMNKFLIDMLQMDLIDGRSFEILKKRYSIMENGRTFTLEEVGNSLSPKISRERVRQIQYRDIKRLRNYLRYNKGMLERFEDLKEGYIEELVEADHNHPDLYKMRCRRWGKKYMRTYYKNLIHVLNKILHGQEISSYELLYRFLSGQDISDNLLKSEYFRDLLHLSDKKMREKYGGYERMVYFERYVLCKAGILKRSFTSKSQLSLPQMPLEDKSSLHLP